MNAVKEDWIVELELLIEKYATPDIQLDYVLMSEQEKWGLYVNLLKHED
jgi:hypothetical protein